MKLSDTQLVLLSRASQRKDRVVEIPENLKGGAARKVVGKLLKEKLLEEVLALDGLPAWRRDETEGAFSLVITNKGMEAIQVEEAEAQQPNPEPAHKPKAAGRKARAAARPKGKGKAAKATLRKGGGGSKQDRVIEMLRRPQGVTIAAIMKATGWQQHSVRGFFAGVVRKKLGLNLVSDKGEGDRTYRITGKPPAGKKPARRKRTAG
jgi:hypothetical protein